MKSRLGADLTAFLESFETPARKGFHCNTYYNDAESCMTLISSDPDLRSSHPLTGPEASFITSAEHIGRSLLHHAGAVYSQDPSAAFPAGCVSLSGSERVLDLCAAPGGKSSQLAMKLTGPEGFLIANEPVMSRNRILIQNMERMGYPNVLVSCLEPRELASRFPSYFDIVLCDAPCSGEGMFRKYPESIGEWSPENVRLCASRQRDILDCAVECLKPGGLLIYSTCTYEAAENEDNVSYLLNSHPMITAKAPEAVINAAVCTSEGCYTFYPHLFEGEGQFVSYLRKEGELTASQASPCRSDNRELGKLISDLDGSLVIDDLPLIKDRKGLIRLIPRSASSVSLSGFTMPGIQLTDSSAKSKRLIPHHQLFKASRDIFRYRLDLSDRPDMALAYIKGMELDLDDLGITDIPGKVYLPVCYKGYVLGGGRTDRNRLKNLYPKGLRYL